MLSALSIAMIVVLVALITWLLLIPYGGCLAGEWSQGASSPKITLMKTGWFTDKVEMPPTVMLGGQAIPTNTTTFELQIRPGTHDVKLLVAPTYVRDGQHAVFATGTVSYNKHEIEWDKPVLGAVKWTKLSKSKRR